MQAVCLHVEIKHQCRGRFAFGFAAILVFGDFLLRLRSGRFAFGRQVWGFVSDQFFNFIEPGNGDSSAPFVFIQG